MICRPSARAAYRRHLAGAVVALLMAIPAGAQWHSRPGAGSVVPCPCPPAVPLVPSLPPPAPGREGEPSRPSPLETSPTSQPNAAPSPFDIGGEAGRAGAGATTALALTTMKGDQLGLPALAFLLPLPPGAAPPGVALPHQGALAPSVRTFKVSEDESPAPQDRAYFDFNYFNNVGASVNHRLGIDLHDIQVYRETFGLEKTFLDGDASAGLRLPVNTLSADSGNPAFSGTDTAVGDLSLILKYVCWQDRQTGNLLSAGLAVTTPTGPSHFASSAIPVLRDVFLQPYLGYRFGRDRLYVQGFFAIDVPTDKRDVTLLFTDVGVGYLLYQRQQGQGCVTGIVPSAELHLTDPLDHRGAFRANDIAGTPDILNLTLAVTFQLHETSTLAFGVVTPLTGPKPFDVEAQVQFNWFFGSRAR